MKLASDVKMDELVKRVKGYSGADVSNVCRDAAMMPLRKLISQGKVITEIANNQDKIDVPITMEDFLAAIRNISKSVSKENLKEYEDWMKEFGCV